MISLAKVEPEQETTSRYAAMIAWTRRDGWRVALGLGITAWGIVATRLFLV